MKLPSDKLFKRRLKQALFTNLSARLERAKQKALGEEQIDEISAETKQNYVHAAFKHGNELHAQIKTTEDPEEKTKLRDKVSKRNQGIIKAANSLKKE